MGCGCGGGATANLGAEAWLATPVRGDAQTFTIADHGPNAEQRARLFVARNGGGHVKAVKQQVKVPAV